MNVAVISNPPRDAAEAGRRRYAALMETLERRVTVRSFDPAQAVSDETCRLILEAARLAPSGANAQPWQFIVVADEALRRGVGAALEASGAEHQGARSAPGCIVVATDFRLSWAFPGLLDGTELDQRYHATAERIILQSVACATMAAHLAATALGYATWWITALGQEDLQAELRRRLEVPEDLTITDVMLFGVPARPVSRRWKKQAADITSWNRFDMANFRSLDQIDAWMRDVRSRAGRWLR